MKLKFPRINPRMFAPALAVIVVIAIIALIIASVSGFNPLQLNPWFGDYSWSFGPEKGSASSIVLMRSISNNDKSLGVCRYFGYEIKSVKFNGDEIPWEYATPVGLGDGHYDTCGNTNRRAILVCPGDPAIETGSLVLFKKDISGFSGSNTLEINYGYTTVTSWVSSSPPTFEIWEPQACSSGLFGVSKGTYTFTK